MATVPLNQADNTVASSARPHRSAQRPEIICDSLPSFNAANLEAVRHAFHSAASCSFGQAWLESEEPDFAPGNVRVGWRENALLVFAELTDADVFNSATTLNQRLWEMGDVLEIFLRASKSESYIELQVTPNNQRLQLCYGNAGEVELARQTGELNGFLIRTEAFRSRTWKSNGAWQVYAEIPASSVPGAGEFIADSQWRFSFGRYDYSRGRKEPVISSTSPHAAPDFHRQQEWGVITFKHRASRNRKTYELRHDLRAITAQFNIEGELCRAAPCGAGHINDTYCVEFAHREKPVRYALQRINGRVFENPVLLIENVQRVTTHLAAKMAGKPDACRRVLTLIQARDRLPYVRDDAGNFWRACVFIENARSYEAVESPRQAFEAARAFGEFQKLLADFPPPPLRETIRDFHHTPKRFAALLKAIEKDEFNRAAEAKNEIEFALQRASITESLLKANLPQRVTHNDAKFNNVMLDDTTGYAVCVVDLDTVMAGLAAYDFGDLVRTMTSPAREDERGAAPVKMDFAMFDALARGYLSEARDFLAPAEIQSLAFAGRLITFETGVRFLTDFLSGDTYFKTHREAHNLDRCRNQFQLVRSIEEQEERMKAMIDSIISGGP